MAVAFAKWDKVLCFLGQKFFYWKILIDKMNGKVFIRKTSLFSSYYNPFPYITDVQQKAQLDLLLLVFNEQIKSQAVKNGDTFVPTVQVINVANFKDYLPNKSNIHLSLAGYKVVSDEFWKAIN